MKNEGRGGHTAWSDIDTRLLISVDEDEGGWDVQLV